MGRKIASYADLLEMEGSDGTLESNAVIKSILVRINKSEFLAIITVAEISKIFIKQVTKKLFKRSKRRPKRTVSNHVSLTFFHETIPEVTWVGMKRCVSITILRWYLWTMVVNWSWVLSSTY